MKKFENVVGFTFFGILEEEYHSDGGWIQYLPAKEDVLVVFRNDKNERGEIKLKAGETLEFTPTAYDFEKRQSIGELTIR